MITNHEGALKMAATEIKTGTNADVVALAKSIVESQTSEIDTLNGLLR